MQWIILILSAISSAGIVMKTGWVGAFYDLWIPILLLIGLFVIFTFVFFAIGSFCSLFIRMDKPVNKRKWIYDFVLTEVVKIILLYARVKIHVSGKDKMPENTRFMMVCNHRSRFDPLVSLAKFGKYKISFVSKLENFRIPVANKFMHKCCFISLAREDMRDAVRMINQAVDLLDRDEASIGIYPEGTRNPSDRLFEFKSGAFKIALKAKVPIIVTTLRNTELVAKRFPFRTTHVYLSVVGVLSYEEIKDMNTKEISRRVVEMMAEDLTHQKNAN